LACPFPVQSEVEKDFVQPFTTACHVAYDSKAQRLREIVQNIFFDIIARLNLTRVNSFCCRPKAEKITLKAIELSAGLWQLKPQTLRMQFMQRLAFIFLA
jgi:hypothetical protein